MELWYTAPTYLNKLDLYSPLFVCNSLLQSNPWHWKFEMLYKLICIKNISNNETLSNILEIVIKYLNQINNFLGSLNKELLYKFFNSIEEFLKLNFRNLTAQATGATQQSWEFVFIMSVEYIWSYNYCGSSALISFYSKQKHGLCRCESNLDSEQNISKSMHNDWLG